MGRPSDILSDYLSPDDVVGDRFVIEQQIGAGAYGAIYLALDRQTGDYVAIKALPPRGRGSSETAIGRFERELKVVLNLEHPNIVHVIDYGETAESILYMVMEFIDGRTLDETVAEGGAMPLETALSVTRQIASALAAAHERGVIHRDLKPANVMLADGVAGYTVKMLDFGMAKLFARLGDESIAALTREGMAVGTPRYIAPEQARGSQRIGPWTDLYAVGLLLYEMIVGQKAVQHDSVEGAVTEHVAPEPLELPGLETAPEDVQHLVRRMVEKDLEERIQSAGEVVAAIDEMSELQFGEATKAERDEIFGPPMGSEEDEQGAGRRAAASEAVARAEREGEIRPEDDSLRLDWEQHRQDATSERPPRKGAGDPTEEWAERVGYAVIGGAVGVALLSSFMVLTAQFHRFDPLARTMVGLTPVVVAVASALISDDSEGSRSMVMLRNLFIFSGLGFLVAHLIGPVQMAKALGREPIWFLEPLTGIPVLSILIDGLGWIARSYAEFIISLLGTENLYG